MNKRELGFIIEKVMKQTEHHEFFGKWDFTFCLFLCALITELKCDGVEPRLMVDGDIF